MKLTKKTYFRAHCLAEDSSGGRWADGVADGSLAALLQVPTCIILLFIIINNDKIV